ncbi:hypothetical protein N7481_009519 [Penicillium waksmanii]|uniref:uncharacterized protein n=1 Tax=Penicillium waksmanii TaxID=69791 RepID=UPI002546C405|nr:uncharacterized protein N7481_009519 [Penicillium waksmanii]KAJ5975812.1 hypothetical protein N7481_009519 [Penicillium waksmanii]
MKASILLLAASAGIALAQPTSLAERDHTESPVCPWYSDDNPLQPTAACCYNMPWTSEHLPYKVCMAPSSAQNTADFEESCRKIKADSRPVCCPSSLITDDESENKGDDLLCTKPKTVN